MTPDYASLVDLLQRRAAANENARAYTFLADGERESSRLSYLELDRAARSIAMSLGEDGVRAGSRALLLYPPGLDFIAAFFGCLYAGVIAVPAYPPHPAQVARALPRLVGIAADAEISVVLANACIASMKEAVAKLAPSLSPTPWIITDEIDRDAGTRWRVPRIDRDSLAFLQYTSGSTAAPRGVMISHANLLHNLAYANYVEENDETSVSVSWLPVIHDMGLIEGVLQPVYAGYPAYLMAPATFLQRPVRWLQAIARYGATNSGGPNFAYDLCVRKIGAEQRAMLDLSTWRVAYNGAEPIRRDTLIAFHEAFRESGFRWRSFYPVYGLAEATLVVSSGRRSYEPVFHDVDASVFRKGHVRDVAGESGTAHTLVSSGPVSFGTTVLIVDPQTQVECESDQVGEIWVASPSVARGYWRRIGETEHAFGAFLRDGRGPFLRTGDLGVLADGELIVTGRLKDLLIVRGLKHYPQDIELTVERSHHGVRPGGVAAFELDTDGDEGVAVAAEIDPRRVDGGDPSASVHDVVTAIRQQVAERHGIQLQAVSLLALGALPKTSSGKVRRHATRAAYADGSLGEVHRWTRPTVLGRELGEPLHSDRVRPLSLRS